MTKEESLKMNKNGNIYYDSKFYDYLMKNKYNNDIASLNNTDDNIVMKFTRFIYTWHPALPNMIAIIRDLYYIIENDPLLSKIFPLSAFSFGYKRHFNIADLISVMRRFHILLEQVQKNAGSFCCNNNPAHTYNTHCSHKYGTINNSNSNSIK